MEELARIILLELYSRVIGDDINYDNVDDFYGYLGYTLEVERDLQKSGIYGTSDLLDFLKGDDE